MLLTILAGSEFGTKALEWLVETCVNDERKLARKFFPDNPSRKGERVRELEVSELMIIGQLVPTTGLQLRLELVYGPDIKTREIPYAHHYGEPFKPDAWLWEFFKPKLEVACSLEGCRPSFATIWVTSTVTGPGGSVHDTFTHRSVIALHEQFGKNRRR